MMMEHYLDFIEIIELVNGGVRIRTQIVGSKACVLYHYTSLHVDTNTHFSLKVPGIHSPLEAHSQMTWGVWSLS